MKRFLIALVCTFLAFALPAIATAQTVGYTDPVSHVKDILIAGVVGLIIGGATVFLVEHNPNNAKLVATENAQVTALGARIAALEATAANAAKTVGTAAKAVA